jgi:putative nucleotidyltransferase-like protein
LPSEDTALDELRALLRASLGLGGAPGAPADEPAVIMAARAHRVAGLLGRPGARGVIDGLSETGREALRGAHRQTLVENMLRLQVLARVARACTEADVPVAPLKGAWLVLRLFRDPGARPMVDLDVLVPVRRFWRACRALRGAGFVVPDPVPLDRFPVRFFYDHHFVHPEMPCSWVEVHRYFGYKSFVAPDYDAVFARAETFEEQGATLLALSPEDTLLHLCVHQAKHGFRILLRDTADVAGLAAGGIDWHGLVARGKTAGAAASLWVALSAAARALGAPVPRDVLGALAPPAGRRARLDALVDLDGGTGLRDKTLATGALEAAMDPRRARWWRVTQRVVRAGDRVRARAAAAR